MHLDAVKAVQDAGEADFIRLVSLALQFSCVFFIGGTILLCGQDFMSKVIFIFSSFFSLTEFSNCCLVICIF